MPKAHGNFGGAEGPLTVFLRAAKSSKTGYTGGRRPLVVEFMGVGGAGKSTLIAECLHLLDGDIEAQGSFSSLEVSGVLKHPGKWGAGLTKFVFRYMFRRRSLTIPGLNGLKEKTYLFLTRVVAHQYKLSHLLAAKAEIYLVEHGPFTFRYDEVAQGGRELKAHSLWADAVVVLEPSRGVALARLLERGVGKGPESQAIAESGEYRDSYWALVSDGVAFARQSGLPLLALDADRPTADLASEVLAFLKALR